MTKYILMTNLFHQFEAPTILGLSMFTLTMTMPPIIILTMKPCKTIMTPRSSIFLTTMKEMVTKNMLMPIKSNTQWFWLLNTVLMFIISMNLIGILPYTFAPTSHLALTMTLAIPLWSASIILGVRTKAKQAISHLLPEGTPMMIVPFMIMIETLSIMARPIALSLRLAINITAGHLLLKLISSATMFMITQNIIPTGLMMVTMIMLTILELAVAMIQAYIFTILTMLYLEENL
uniref:ATP synthase subunit a n=1 Tax=Xenoturbella monstrosa TaxID=1755483 RepID=A0A0U2VH63_9BILA|nr:ATP synthase F0 subunit 6 [Xenoturbella monstrosa]ALS20082.1 ATP synthase F0 subunit 6 [Xenoturbella monstrosa]